MALSGLELAPGRFPICLGVFAANSDACSASVLHAIRSIRITAVQASVNTAVAAHETNFNKLALYADSVKLVDLFDTTQSVFATGVAMGAGHVVSFAVPAATQYSATSGTNLHVHFVHGSAGAALKGLTLQLDGELIPE